MNNTNSFGELILNLDDDVWNKIKQLKTQHALLQSKLVNLCKHPTKPELCFELLVPYFDKEDIEEAHNFYSSIVENEDRAFKSGQYTDIDTVVATTKQELKDKLDMLGASELFDIIHEQTDFDDEGNIVINHDNILIDYPAVMGIVLGYIRSESTPEYKELEGKIKKIQDEITELVNIV